MKVARVLVLISLIFFLMACSGDQELVDTTPPVIPTGLFVAAGDGMVSVSWTANSEPDLDSYTVYWGVAADALNQSKTVSAPATETEITGLTNGTTYFIALDAVDKADNASDKTEVVSATPTEPDTTPPTIVSTSPANAATGVAVDTALSVTFSELMDVSSVSVTVSPEVNLGDANWSGDGLTVAFQPGDELAFNQTYTVTVAGNDPAGNALAGSSFSFTTANLPDTTPPTVASNSPADGASGVPSATNISLSFSEPMNRASVEAAFDVEPAVTCSFAWSADDTLVTCIPSAELATSTAYMVTLAAAAADTGGNTLEAAHSFSFTTAAAPDTTPPTVSSTSPTSGEQGAARRPGIVVTFSEPMDKASAQAAFSITSPGGFNSGVFSWNSEGTVMTYLSDATFNYGQNVNWRVSTAAKDLAGNAMTADVTRTFRVRRQQTVKLFSVASLDGNISNTGTVQTGGIFDGTVGDMNNNTYRRGFLSFDLSTLPSDLIQINGATLNVRQAIVAGDPYGKMGNLLAESVAYSGSLVASNFETPVLKTNQCIFAFPGITCGLFDESRVLSTNANLEFKSVTATLKVRDDWSNRATRANRSQYRLRFAQNVSADGVADFVIFGTGDASADFQSFLEITYEYP
jgi:hypothetical protein